MLYVTEGRSPHIARDRRRVRALMAEQSGVLEIRQLTTLLHLTQLFSVSPDENVILLSEFNLGS